jgi:hypothetical protein
VSKVIADFAGFSNNGQFADEWDAKGRKKIDNR